VGLFSHLALPLAFLILQLCCVPNMHVACMQPGAQSWPTAFVVRKVMVARS
jgi:hypothetical protein